MCRSDKRKHQNEALVKSEGEGNDGRDAGLQRVVYVIRHLLNATTSGVGRKGHALNDSTLLRTDGIHHSDEALLDEGLHPIMASSGEQGCGKHHN